MPETMVSQQAVAYSESGEGGGPPLLLMHGFTGSKDDFAGVVSELSSDRRVLAVDLPGHAGSAGSDDPGDYSLAKLAAWLIQVTDRLGLDEFHLLGHSFGGLVAQRVAAMASQRLRSLILMDTGLGAPREEVCRIAGDIAVAVRDVGMQAGWEVSQRARALRDVHLETDGVNEEFAHARFLALEPACVIAEASGIITAEPLGAFLRGIDLPVLVIHGEHEDVWLPSQQRLLARTINGAQLVVVPNSRHSPQVENPKAWLGAITDFLAQADKAAIAPRRSTRRR